MKNWQANFYEQLDLARDLILPNAEQSKSGGKTKKKAALAAETSGAAIS